jgi:aromatase
MPETPTHEMAHETTVAAPAKVLYELIADVRNWPQIFPPSVHVEYAERGETRERIQIWATANGQAKTWISRRELDPGGLRVDFRQEVSSPPVAGMGGAWVVESLGPDLSRVRLLHDYRALDDDPETLAWIERAVDRNSQAELAALKENAELAAGSSARMLTFDDSVEIAGRRRDVYDFINEAQLWVERLPHVARVRLDEDTPGLQRLEMDTRAKDGSTHTTTSVRVCRPDGLIAYKQTQLPPLMTLHTGQWILEETAGGVSATSRHTVVIDEAKIADVLGREADLEQARTMVRDALGANSRATLGFAKAYAESR